jgi:hypothetical protein
MPRLPINYANTIIYKIVCNDLSVTDCYVGHTTDFVRRKQSHKYRCAIEKDKKHNLKIYKAIRDNKGWENWCIVEIEKFPCEDSLKACARERYYYEQLHSTLNTNFPQRSRKKFYLDNKEKISEDGKEYREEKKVYISQRNKSNRVLNKEQIKERRTKLFVCECGREINHGHKLRHLRTQIHKELMLCKDVVL